MTNCIDADREKAINIRNQINLVKKMLLKSGRACEITDNKTVNLIVQHAMKNYSNWPYLAQGYSAYTAPSKIFEGIVKSYDNANNTYNTIGKFTLEWGESYDSISKYIIEAITSVVKMRTHVQHLRSLLNHKPEFATTVEMIDHRAQKCANQLLMANSILPHNMNTNVKAKIRNTNFYGSMTRVHPQELFEIADKKTSGSIFYYAYGTQKIQKLLERVPVQAVMNLKYARYYALVYHEEYHGAHLDSTGTTMFRGVYVSYKRNEFHYLSSYAATRNLGNIIYAAYGNSPSDALRKIDQKEIDTMISTTS